MKLKSIGAVALSTILLASSAQAVDVKMLFIGDTKAYNEILEGAAKSYMAAHPDVNIILMPMENEALKAKLPTMLQSNDPPHIFTSWGGGVMLDHYNAGYLADLSAEKESLGQIVVPAAVTAFQVDGQQVGVATDLSLVSIWVNKPLLEKGGVSLDELKTWDGFKGAVAKLKAAGITPLLTSGGDKWPLQFYLGYLLLREGGPNAIDKLKAEGFMGPEFLKAAQDLIDLGKLEPFQDGWLGKSWPDSSGQFGDQLGAMYLMGGWIVGQQKQDAKDGVGVLPENLTAVGFPAGFSGAGDGTETLGGISGFEIGKNAPPEAVDFLKYWASRDQQKPLAEQGLIIPSAIGSVDDLAAAPLLQDNARTIAASSKHQNFIDQDLGADLGRVFNDVATALAAGEMTPEEAAQTLQEAWENK